MWEEEVGLAGAEVLYTLTRCLSYCSSVTSHQKPGGELISTLSHTFVSPDIPEK